MTEVREGFVEGLTNYRRLHHPGYGKMLESRVRTSNQTWIVWRKSPTISPLTFRSSGPLGINGGGILSDLPLAVRRRIKPESSEAMDAGSRESIP